MKRDPEMRIGMFHSRYLYTDPDPYPQFPMDLLDQRIFQALSSPFFPTGEFPETTKETPEGTTHDQQSTQIVTKDAGGHLFMRERAPFAGHRQGVLEPQIKAQTGFLNRAECA